MLWCNILKIAGCMMPFFCKTCVSYFEEDFKIPRSWVCNAGYSELWYKKLTMSLFVVCKKGEMKRWRPAELKSSVEENSSREVWNTEDFRRETVDGEFHADDIIPSAQTQALRLSHSPLLLQWKHRLRYFTAWCLNAKSHIAAASINFDRLDVERDHNGQCLRLTLNHQT